ncbi:hypothetical protein LY78DRAFT_24339 [Colletotrichum sublineola]|nr:hypothetical protein LY78DRAFT_24339 [Colletotrichum sublineola]
MQESYLETGYCQNRCHAVPIRRRTVKVPSNRTRPRHRQLLHSATPAMRTHTLHTNSKIKYAIRASFMSKTSKHVHDCYDNTFTGGRRVFRRQR